MHWKYKVWKFINNFSSICAYLFCIVMKLICTLFIQEQFEFFSNAHYFLFSAILSLVGVQVPNVKRWMVTRLFEKGYSFMLRLRQIDLVFHITVIECPFSCIPMYTLYTLYTHVYPGIQGIHGYTGYTGR